MALSREAGDGQSRAPFPGRACHRVACIGSAAACPKTAGTASLAPRAMAVVSKGQRAKCSQEPLQTEIVEKPTPPCHLQSA
ncbi:unnamed protein product [Rangifer tarandus platyrhynchus]|uniref:Uncharacterized protein n=2 Tax=Rangifer tarandus platyrhynchus TaxID=3082113 RepID=A0ABN8ZD39_RANTA|nr:unnamed protein product [Rangifer tarandus platyrhynchus]CAI9707760.1 unnamed protein product [Rangifer tarandus platyrhynchus]